MTDRDANIECATERRSLVSIGMPVFNGGSTLRTALDSLLAQTHSDIELVISDNASNDETAAVCAEYAARDSRVTYRRNETNIGPAMNFVRVLELARGKYFMWAAHDDEWEPDYVAENVQAIEGHDGVIGSVSRVEMIPPCRGGEAANGTFGLMGSSGENLSCFLWQPGMNSRVYGVFQTDVLRRCFRLSDLDMWGGDWFLIVRLLQCGKMFEVERKLFRRHNNYVSLATIARSHRQIISAKWRRLFPLATFTRKILADPKVPKNATVLFGLLRHNLVHTFQAWKALTRDLFLGRSE